jgi:5-methylcytosine-specific restriction protein A
MKKYIKNYLKFHNIGEQDILICEECGAVAHDLHHIKKRSQGGTDEVNNLKSLCRVCHEQYH